MVEYIISFLCWTFLRPVDPRTTLNIDNTTTDGLNPTIIAINIIFNKFTTKQKEEEAMAKAREDKQYIVKSEVKAQAIENVNKLFNKIVSENWRI